MARQSQRILQERAASGNLDIASMSSMLKQQFESSDDQRNRLRALWARWVIGGLSESELLSITRDRDEYVRGWAVYLIGELTEFPSQETLASLAERCREEKSLVARRYLASLLQRLPVQDRLPLIEGLVSHRVSSHDHNIPLLVWYGMEPLAGESPRGIVELASGSGWQDLDRFTIRRAAESAVGREVLVEQLIELGQPAKELMILEELVSAATRRGGAEMPNAWPRAFARLSESKEPRVVELSRATAVQFGDQSVLPHFREVLADSTKPLAVRLMALTALRTVKDSQLSELLVRLLDDPAIAGQAAAGLAAFDDPVLADELLTRMHSLQGDSRTSALNTLVSREVFADRFVAALESGRVDAGSVPAFIVRQAVELGDASLIKRLEQTWGQISVSSADKKELYARYRALLRPQAIASADASRGRALYEANCGKCHKLFGAGGQIGPDITGANRTSVDYWLENMLEPNALIGRGYQMTSVLTNSGRVIHGIIQEENEDAITLQTATEIVVIPKDEIDVAKLSTVSLMPEGQLQPMSDQQVCDLMKYLTGPSQVSLPDHLE